MIKWNKGVQTNLDVCVCVSILPRLNASEDPANAVGRRAVRRVTDQKKLSNTPRIVRS